MHGFKQGRKKRAAVSRAGRRRSFLDGHNHPFFSRIRRERLVRRARPKVCVCPLADKRACTPNIPENEKRSVSQYPWEPLGCWLAGCLSIFLKVRWKPSLPWLQGVPPSPYPHHLTFSHCSSRPQVRTLDRARPARPVPRVSEKVKSRALKGFLLCLRRGALWGVGGWGRKWRG